MSNLPKNVENDDELALVETLVASDDYRRLVDCREAFNLFECLGAGLIENASSRAMAFLFDSQRAHGLGTRLWDAWIRALHRESISRQNRFGLEKLLAFTGADTRTVVEWSTEERRRVDVLVQVYDPNRKLKGVLGIENKHPGRDEEDRQVGHYQDEIARRFAVETAKAVVFLTPDGHSSETANKNHPTCPYFSCSYRTVMEALEENEAGLDGELRLLVNSLKVHVKNKVMGGESDMEQKVREIVGELYRNEDHRRAIKLISKYLPSLGHLAETILTKTRNRLSAGATEGETFDLYRYPERRGVESLAELGLIPKHVCELTIKRGFELRYVIRNNDGEPPDVGDEITALLLGVYHDNAVLDRIKKFGRAASLPPSQRTYKSWSGCYVLWTGPSYCLQDLGRDDVEGCIKLFEESILATYQAIRRAAEGSE